MRGGFRYLEEEVGISPRFEIRGKMQNKNPSNNNHNRL